MAQYKFDAVKRYSLSHQVLEKLIELLNSGQLKSGDILPSELTLMKQFDVSRPILREALSSLESMDIISRIPGGGKFINDKIGSTPFRAMLSISMDNILAIIEARMSLEVGLVMLAAEKITNEEIAKLEETIQGIEENINQDYGRYDIEFHKIIANSANNPVLEGMITSLLLTHEKTNSLIEFREPKLTIAHHESIVQALRDRNPTEAALQMHKHLTFVKDKILKGYEQSQKESK